MKIIEYLTKDYGKGNDYGLLILRIVAGLVLLYGHGFEKLTIILTGQEIQFMDPVGLGATLSFYLVAFAEGICAILLVLGLFTRWSALILSINFLVILLIHAFIMGDGFQVLEVRFFYLASYISLLLLGAGRISLDYLLFKPKQV